MIYSMKVSDRVISHPMRDDIIQNGIESDTLRVSFDSEWTGLGSCRAVFVNGDVHVAVLFTAKSEVSIEVPWEVLEKPGCLFVTFVGYPSSGGRIATRMMDRPMKVAESGRIDGTEGKEPTLDEIGQVLQSLNDALREVESATAAASSATTAATGAASDANEAAGSATTAAEAANEAAGSATSAAGAANEAAGSATSAAEAANEAAGSAASAAEAANEAADSATTGETARATAESARVKAEAARVEAEKARASAETQRSSAESARATAEEGRAGAETVRAEAESGRIQAESDRASAENARAEAEEDRADAEALRISAEQERATAQAKNNADQQANNASAQGLVAVILTSGEYDPDTLEPTVEGAVGKMYLVPMPQAQAVAAAIPVRFSLQSQDDGTYVATQAAAADGDTYVEWLWIAGAWERIGLSTATIDPITTDQIDAVCSDGAPQGKQVLNLTGLSYLWAKVKAWATGAFAALSHTHPASQVTGLTASRALVSDSSGHPAASAVTATELGYLDGVKSGVQGQIDALGDSLSQLEDSGWINTVYGSRYRKKNGVLYIEFKGASVDAGNQLLFTLPEGFRPDRNQDALPVPFISDSVVGKSYVGVYASGEVRSNLGVAGFLWATVTLVL